MNPELKMPQMENSEPCARNFFLWKIEAQCLKLYRDVGI